MHTNLDVTLNSGCLQENKSKISRAMWINQIMQLADQLQIYICCHSSFKIHSYFFDKSSLFLMKPTHSCLYQDT